MRSFSIFVRLLIFAGTLGLFQTAFAREILVTQERTVIYTGPGKFFRPLINVPAGTELPIGKKTIKGKSGGEFYKVLVVLSNRKKAIGYLSMDSGASKKSNSDPNEELESFEDYQLTKQALQVSYLHLKTGRFLVSGGFISFVGPGLYLKGWGGAFKTKDDFSPVGGIEFGSDALIYRRWSGYIAAALGVFLKPKGGTLFPGNKNDLSNFLVQGTVGVRYTTKNLTSYSVGGAQGSLFNSNNSTITWGALVSVEFPL